MTAIIQLPDTHGQLQSIRLEAAAPPSPASGQWNRIGYAAAHVVCNPLQDNNPWLDTSVDWDRTLAYRDYLWGLGFGVAEAMDTAQRGMGLSWETSLELVQRSMEIARSKGHLIASGAGTDHLDLNTRLTLDDVIAGYEMQCEAIEATGSRVILMASRALTAVAKTPDDYAAVYSRVLSGLKQPAILHWLGEMFDPALRGYWGAEDHMAAMNTCLNIIRDNAANIDGIKISLLSTEKEIHLRNQLPASIKMYTGDDFNYPELIQGDDDAHSHALLGIFDPIAGAAAKALSALGEGNLESYNKTFAPTVPLSRHIFKAPTRFYKTGVVFMAYLNGHQDHFTMIGGQESARSTLHLAELIRLANDAKLFTDPDDVVRRAKPVFAARGVEICP